MGRLLVASVAALLALAPAVASADVFVTADIFKDKDKLIFEFIAIAKVVDLRVSNVLVARKAAESMAIVNQENYDNHVCENCAEKRDRIAGSGNNNSGVVSINQAAGNMNNQASVIAIAVDVTADPGPEPRSDGFAEAQAAADQRNGVPIANTVETVDILFRDAEIASSLNNNTGVVHVNQATGNMSNQANVLSLAASFAAGVAMAESDLGQVNVGNTVRESSSSGVTDVGVPKRATIVGSISGNSGVVGVNQTVGNMANQGNVVSIGFAAR